mmetsp:Transcript_33983/g.60101  ORF Transcript_33983/g.60101 Transcript_33983/m.60101 type:complete len:114 (+) Transcript_33983:1093-1434(+)
MMYGRIGKSMVPACVTHSPTGGERGMVSILWITGRMVQIAPGSQIGQDYGFFWWASLLYFVLLSAHAHARFTEDDTYVEMLLLLRNLSVQTMQKRAYDCPLCTLGYDGTCNPN